MYDISEGYATDIVTFGLQYSIWFGLGQMLSFAHEKHALFCLFVCFSYVSPRIFA